MFVRVCNDYSDVIRALRDRTDEMQISRGAIDFIGGLSDGYSSKLLSEHPSKILGPMSMGPTLETLGLRLMLVEDTAATARTIERRTPVVSSHQRFCNQSNPKKIKSTRPAVLIPAASNEDEKINTTVDLTRTPGTSAKRSAGLARLYARHPNQKRP
jgi:hypothetical protein